MKGQGGEYDELVGGVYSLDIVCGVGFGVAKLLRLLQCRGEIEPLGGHPAKDIVGGTIDNGINSRDLIGQKVLLEWGDQGDAPAHTGLVEDIHSLFFSQGEELGEMLCHHLLIGSDYIFPPPQRLVNKFHSGVLAAQNLDYYIDLRVAYDLCRVGGKEIGVHL